MADGVSLMRWRCRRGHVLGWVERRGNGRHVLLLLRQALEETPSLATPPPAPPQNEYILERGAVAEYSQIEVMARVEGFVGDVRCSVCGEVRSWFPNGKINRRSK